MSDRVPRYYFSDSGLHMSHFDICQLTLIWLAHITTDSPALGKCSFINILVTVLYYISIYVGAKRLAFHLSPRDGHGIIVSGCLI